MPPVTNHTITVSIAGTDRSAHLRKDSLFVRSNIGNTTDIAEFTIVDDGSFQILDWSEVLIAVNGTRIFGGYITNSSGTAVGDGANKTTLWSVECRDWSAIFDVTTVNVQYTDVSDATIIQSLFTGYMSLEGFDATTNITSQYADVDISFDHITFREALEQLATATRANWHMAPDKSFYWYAEEDPSAAAFNIDTVSPNNTTTFDVLTNSLKVTQDSMEIVNRVTVIGGWQQSGTKQIDLLTSTASDTIYGPLTEPPSAMWSITFVDSNDVVRTAYANDIGVYPVTVLDDDGNEVYDSGRSFIVTANLDTQYIEFDLTSIAPATLKEGGVITVQYYYKQPIEVTRNDVGSQGQYDRVFHRYVFDENLNDLKAATRYADRILDEFSNGRITVRFDITRHGLLPGRLITINTPAFNISTVLGGLFWQNDRSGYYLLEGGTDRLALENYDTTRNFLIQEVAIQTVVTQQNQFMIVASITAGRWIRSLTDSAKREQQNQYKSGLRAGNRTYGSLSQISGALGEIATGRAVFTDGGTAQFAWSDYASHTGVVVGLEDVNLGTPLGATYILQGGTVKAKMGKLDGLAAVGGGTPADWGLWTNNGYFSGVIAANAGQIGGWTIAANAIYADGGTVSTRIPPVNSSNPGVYMSTAGLFGYGTLGLTFSIPADPALRPTFSSGTILETVYEVTNAAVIRTGTINPRVQIDNSGIFAYNSGGTALFTVDAATGRMTASDGTFSGSVTASQISGGTVTGGQISGGTVTGALVTGGTLTAFGGSVSISDTLGLNLICAAGTSSFDDQRFIRWRNQTSDAVAAQIGAASTVNANEMYLFSGTAGTINSSLYMRAYGTIDGTAGDYATWGVRNDIVFLDMVRSGVQVTNPIIVGAGSVVTGGSVYPRTSNVYSLGGTANAWTALYLHDGTDEWRVTINTSGVLTTVKV